MQQTLTFRIDNRLFSVRIEAAGSGFFATVNDRKHHVVARPGGQGRIELDIDGKHTRAFVANRDGTSFIAMNGETWTIGKPESQPARRGSTKSGDGRLSATMPGLVLDVLVEPGTTVRKGETLVLLEAMKMELRITAPADGTVTAVHCRAGEVVERGRKLIAIGPVDNQQQISAGASIDPE